MSNTPHELAEEFPADIEKMHRLKLEDAHFAKLFDEYHDVNAKIHRAETHIDAMAEHYEDEMRKKRVMLKDQIASMLSAAS